MQSKHQIIEAVVNISEGRDHQIINDLINEINRPGDVMVAHSDIGYDANRTVLTIIGKVLAVFDGVDRLIGFSNTHLDIKKQKGEHPRLGIVDVIPFVALENICHDDLLLLAKSRLEEIGRRYNLPILYYGDLSKSGELALFHLRKWKMEKELGHNIYADAGPHVYHPTLGVSCATVRKLMTAFNINLDTQDLALAKRVARELKELRKDASIAKRLDTRDVRYLAWYMKDYNCCQISTNIYDVSKVSLSALYDHVAQVSAKCDVSVDGSELIGLVARDAICDKHENLEETLGKIRLDSVRPFDPAAQILDYVCDRLIWSD